MRHDLLGSLADATVLVAGGDTESRGAEVVERAAAAAKATSSGAGPRHKPRSRERSRSVGESVCSTVITPWLQSWSATGNRRWALEGEPARPTPEEARTI